MKSKIFQLQKKSSKTFELIQDKIQIESKNLVCAIADGSTQSFRSEIWAHLLVSEFCMNPQFNKELFLDLVCDLAKKLQSVDPRLSESAAIASLEKSKFKKGSTSTFLGVKLEVDGRLRILGVGDCNLFVLKESGKIISIPYQNASELSSNQSFLNSVNLSGDERVLPKVFVHEILLDEKDEIVICSDAIAKYLLKNISEVGEIIHLNSFESFLNKIQRLWTENKLEEDDITLIYLNDLANKKLDIGDVIQIVPPSGFEFPDPPKPPPPPPPPKGIFINIMDLETIMYNFGCIQRDFDTIKRKQNNLQRLLTVLITLILVIASSFFFLQLKENDEKPKDGETHLKSQGIIVDEKSTSSDSSLKKKSTAKTEIGKQGKGSNKAHKKSNITNDTNSSSNKETKNSETLDPEKKE